MGSSGRAWALVAAGALGCVPGLQQTQTAPPWLEPHQAPKPGEEREDVPFDSFRVEHHQDDYGEIFGWRVAERRYFVPPRRCEQGPLQLRLEWEPSAYVDVVDLVVYAPRAIEGRVLKMLDSDGEYGFEGDLGIGRRPDNAACVVGRGDAPATAGSRTAGAAPSGTPSAAVGAPSRGSGGRPTAPPPPHQLAKLDAALAPVATLTEIPMPASRPFGRRVAVAGHEQLNVDLETGRPRPRASSMTIAIWFQQPNDLEGATFAFARHVAVPLVAEEAIRARGRLLRERKEAKDRETEQWHRGQRQRDEERQRFCDAHHGDTGCWGKGGYDGAVARQAEAELHPPPSPAAALAALGPPPAPLADPQPPRSSANAEWVPGYWQWLEGQWISDRGALARAAGRRSPRAHGARPGAAARATRRDPGARARPRERGGRPPNRVDPRLLAVGRRAVRLDRRCMASRAGRRGRLGAGELAGAWAGLRVRARQVGPGPRPAKLDGAPSAPSHCSTAGCPRWLP